MPGIAEKVRSRTGLSRGRADHRTSARATVRLAAPAAAALALCLLAGCSLDYQEATAAEQAAANTPDTVAIGLVHKIHKGGRLSLQLEASRAESYDSRNQTVLTNAHFVEFDVKGATATEGRARTVVFHSDTENAEISGAVHVHSTMEKGDVSADSLSWVNKTKILVAPPSETVTITKDDGSSLSGSGFKGDFRKREVTFSGPVKGTYVRTDENK
jgi:LPS export ABC transporter protein LptC